MPLGFCVAVLEVSLFLHVGGPASENCESPQSGDQRQPSHPCRVEGREEAQVLLQAGTGPLEPSDTTLIFSLGAGEEVLGGFMCR